MNINESTDAPRVDWRNVNDRLVRSIKPVAQPVAISFVAEDEDSGLPRLDYPYPVANTEGRTGQVPAGCVFWIHGSHTTFETKAGDHANCSVGSYTHGFLTLEEAASKDDVSAVLESGWVDQAAVRDLPVVSQKPDKVIYGPLSEATSSPDVVLLRVNGLGLMTIKNACPEMRIEGKPQCHIVAIAKEYGVVAASVGCALSRSRTGMKAEEMTCAIPGMILEELSTSIEDMAKLDRAMATYASEDAKRFLR